MSNIIPNEELRELLALYALEALDPSEAKRVEDYLASNPEVLKVLNEHQEDLAKLALSLPQEKAPAYLEEKTLSRIRTLSGQNSPINSGPIKIVEQPATVRKPAMPNPTTRFSMAWFMAASIAAISLAGFGFWKNNNLQQQLNAKNNLQLSVEQLLQNPKTQTFLLLTPNGKFIGRAMMDEHQAMLTHSLGHAARGKTWQAWYFSRNSKTPKPLSTFGDAGVIVEIPNDVVALAISEEPSGGSLTPTKVMAVGKL